MDQNFIFPALMGFFVLLMIARRVMRNIGRQPVQPGRMQLRIALLTLIGVLFAFAAWRDPAMLGALLGGTVAGVALGWFGLRHTRFEKTQLGDFYTPHTWIGAAVSLLLIARLAYRFIVVLPTMQAAQQADQSPFAALQKSPLTLAIFGVLIGYYVFYYLGVLRVSKNTPSAAVPADAAAKL